MICEIASDDPLAAHLALEAFADILPPSVVAEALASEGIADGRVRKLPVVVTVCLCIAMHLYAHEALPSVFRQLVSGLRWIWPQPDVLAVSKGAICQARYRLSAHPLVGLFHAVCRPMATTTTPEAFLFGYRLMALDAALLDVPDTPANDRVFGRPTTARGRSAWPQAQLVALCECGTHAICDAGVWRYDANPHAAARRLLRSLDPSMLVLWDRGLHSYDLVAEVVARDGQFLSRLPSGAKPTAVLTLPDGTQLVRLAPSDRARRRQGEHVIVRLIGYTLDDPNRPGHLQAHRLITSLLDPQAAPALDLVVAYHARWEFELAVDEIVTHQRPDRPLRNQKPVGVIQEVYALLVAHYVVRAVMVDAAATADLPPTRLSFLTSLHLLREALPDFQRAAPGEHGRIAQRLLADIVAATRQPHQSTRRQTENVKIPRQTALSSASTATVQTIP